MRKHAFFLVTLLCMSLVCSACSGEQATSGSPNSSNADEATIDGLDLIMPSEYSSVKELNLNPGSCLSLIVYDTEDHYWKLFENGANQAIKDLNTLLNYKEDDEITLSYCAPRESDDIDDQVSLLDEELARFPIAVGIAPIDEKAFGVQFDLAKEDGIPVVTFHASNVNKNVASHIGTDNIAASKVAATELANAIGKSGEIAVFVHDSSEDAQNRLEGFTSAITSDFPDVKIVNTCILDEIDDSMTPQDAIKDVLEKNPNLKGIYTTDAHTTQLVANHLTAEQKDDLAFIGFDGGKAQMNLLKKGVVDGLIIQNPYGMGYATVVAMVRAHLGLSTESFVNSGYVWVTNDNKKSAAVKNFIY